MIEPLGHIGEMAPYALAKMPVAHGSPPISLAQNESLRPPSPGAVAAATRCIRAGALYPDPDWMELRTALAHLHGLDAGEILCGAGSLDLIGCIARAYAGPERAVLAPAHAYPFFRTASQMAGARFDTAGEINATVSVDNLLAALRHDTSVVFVANPGNPTGTHICAEELRRLRRELPSNVLLVIDEAYGEFSDHAIAPTFDLVKGGNCIVLRTFSKAYGLAGMRIGWGVFPLNIAAEIRKLANPNNVTTASQAAACAALQDQSYMLETCRLTAQLRDTAASRLTQEGFTVLPSLTNFLSLDLGTTENAQAAFQNLAQSGIFLRPQGGAGLPHVLRMTVAKETHLSKAVEHLVTWKLGGRI